MAKHNYKDLAKRFREFHGVATPETEIEVHVFDDGVELWPASSQLDTNTFFQMEEVVDFCRVAKLSHYVSYEDGKIVVHMY